LRDAISEHLKTAAQKEDKFSVAAISSDVAAIQSSVEREIIGIEVRLPTPPLAPSPSFLLLGWHVITFSHFV
jgi:hypothetical protein